MAEKKIVSENSQPKPDVEKTGSVKKVKSAEGSATAANKPQSTTAKTDGATKTPAKSNTTRTTTATAKPTGTRTTTVRTATPSGKSGMTATTTKTTPPRTGNGQRTANPATRTDGTRPATAAAVRPAAPPPPPKPAAPPPPPPSVELPSTITVRDLAIKLKLTPIDIIKKLMANGVMANITQSIDYDTAALIASELGFEVREEKPLVVEEPEVVLSSMPKKREFTPEELAKLKPRPPVVTVMGHVDHGKTSLLDAIRHTDVVAGEFGGITQHIGAYQVEHNGKPITFLDTPSHEAFTAMRARGARSTDIAIIVVAADDGVMPTTREAIEHARAANVPIVVALNKIDRPNANIERAKQQLSETGLEVYGGKDEVTVVPISAKQRIGIDDLLENILLIAELADLRANPEASPTGIVIESRLDKQQGPTATLLVQEGTLRVGDVVLAGEAWGKVRALFNERGEIIEQVSPGTPAVVTGLSDVPPAGQPFTVVAAEQIARARANERALARRANIDKAPAITLNDLYAKFKEGQVRELNLVIKADVAGSLEPIVSSLEKLGDENLHAKVIRQGIGTVTQADVMLAATSQGIIIAFNVGVESAAETLAQQENVDVRNYNIIYKLIEDVDKALKGMLEPEYKDVLAGRAQVLKVFNVRKNVVAGCRVVQGKVARGTTAHVLRNGAELFSGGIASLKRFTEDVKEVAEGYECGISLDNFNDLREGDVLEFFRKERVS